MRDRTEREENTTQDESGQNLPIQENQVQVLVRDSESRTDRVTYWGVDSCVVRVINERLVENKTLVLL